MLLTPVTAKLVHGAVPQFARFEVSNDTYIQQVIAFLLVGLLAALVPMVRSARVKIVDGLRHVG
jgi:putative ABC transport system permease protein